MRRQADRERTIIFIDVGYRYTAVVFGRGGEISFAKEIANELSKASDDDRKLMSARFDELSTILKAKPFLSREFGCEIEVFSADDPNRVDPRGKARYAKPGRPAVYLE